MVRLAAVLGLVLSDGDLLLQRLNLEARLIKFLRHLTRTYYLRRSRGGKSCVCVGELLLQIGDALFQRCDLHSSLLQALFCHFGILESLGGLELKYTSFAQRLVVLVRNLPSSTLVRLELSF